MGASRPVRIRSDRWVQRLGLLAWVPQDAFRKDRNLHAELLLQCIEDGQWLEPVNRHPPDGPLPMLAPHVACALRRRREERLELSRGMAAALPEASTIFHCSEDDSQKISASSDCLRYSREERSASSDCLRHSRTEAIPHGSARSDASASGPAKSLAHAAATAVGNSGAEGASAPRAYATLAARVVHLQDENRRLRSQLNQARSASRQKKPVRIEASTPYGRWVKTNSRARGVFAGTPTGAPRSVSCSAVTSSGNPMPAPPPSVGEEWAAPLPSSSAGRLPAKPRSPFRSPGLKDTGLDAMRSVELDRQTCSPRRLEGSGLGLDTLAASALDTFVRSSSPAQPIQRQAGASQERRSPERRHRSASPVTAAVAHAALNSSPCTPPPLPVGCPASATPCRATDSSRHLDSSRKNSSRSTTTAPLAPLGAPPPEDDTEGFLRYLDKFQEHAERLCVLPSARAASARSS